MSRTLRAPRQIALGLETLDDRILPSPMVTGLAHRHRQGQFGRHHAGAFSRPFRGVFRAPAAVFNNGFLSTGTTTSSTFQRVFPSQPFRAVASGDPTPVSTGGIFTDTSGQQVFYQLRPSDPTASIDSSGPDITPGTFQSVIPNQPYRTPSTGTPTSTGGVYTDTSGQQVYYQLR